MAFRYVSLLENIGKAAAITGTAIGLLSQCVFVVEPGHRGVIFSRNGGIIQETYDEGIHLKIPWVHKVQYFDVRTRANEITSTTGSKDLQTINVTLRVLCKPEVDALPRIISGYGINYKRKILPSIGNEVLKAVIAQYDPSELITRREHVSNQIREALTERASDFGIILDDVALTELSFSEEYIAAIERKQVAEQDAERAKYVVLKSEQEKEAAIVRAEGESEAARLISDAITEHGPALLELRRIETANHIAKVLSTCNNVTYLPSSSGSGSDESAKYLLKL